MRTIACGLGAWIACLAGPALAAPQAAPSFYVTACPADTLPEPPPRESRRFARAEASGLLLFTVRGLPDSCAAAIGSDFASREERNAYLGSLPARVRVLAGKLGTLPEETLRRTSATRLYNGVPLEDWYLGRQRLARVMFQQLDPAAPFAEAQSRVCFVISPIRYSESIMPARRVAAWADLIDQLASVCMQGVERTPGAQALDELVTRSRSDPASLGDGEFERLMARAALADLPPGWPEPIAESYAIAAQPADGIPASAADSVLEGYLTEGVFVRHEADRSTYWFPLRTGGHCRASIAYRDRVPPAFVPDGLISMGVSDRCESGWPDVAFLGLTDAMVGMDEGAIALAEEPGAIVAHGPEPFRAFGARALAEARSTVPLAATLLAPRADPADERGTALIGVYLDGERRLFVSPQKTAALQAGCVVALPARRSAIAELEAACAGLIAAAAPAVSAPADRSAAPG